MFLQLIIAIYSYQRNLILVYYEQKRYFSHEESYGICDRKGKNKRKLKVVNPTITNKHSSLYFTW